MKPSKTEKSKCLAPEITFGKISTTNYFPVKIFFLTGNNKNYKFELLFYSEFIFFNSYKLLLMGIWEFLGK